MADGLLNWNFQDAVKNGTEALVNRQKSAVNLLVLDIDKHRRTGAFLDREKNVRHLASLSSCDCRDFRFVGSSQRKTLQPCQHIYRLAMELGLLRPRHLDHRAREAIRSHRLDDLNQIEDYRLANLGRDSSQWGQWPAPVHQSGLQRNRQYRAYFICDDEPDRIELDQSGWHVRDHAVTLEACDCGDFGDRQLPCKHIYAVALETGLILSLGRSEYLVARRQGLERVFEFDIERDGPSSSY